MTTFITILGFMGAFCFAMCTLPQILRVLKRKSTADISLLFIILSLGGNLCSATYIFYTNFLSGYWQIPQYFNYSIATTLVVILLCLKIKYDKKQIKESIRRSTSEMHRMYFNLQYALYEKREKICTIFFIVVLSLSIMLYIYLT